MSVKQEGVSPLSYLKIFFRRKELLIIPAFLGLVVGICTGIVLPKQYQSTTVILVEEGKEDNPLFKNIAVSTTVQQRLTTIRESLLGWNSLVKLVKRLGLDKDIKSTPAFERLILGIRKNILINLKGQNILQLSFIGGDPGQTQQVVKNITEIFVERNKEIQAQETADAITFIDEQLKVYLGKIKSADIAGMQEQLDALLIDSTDKHPLVKKLREDIENKKEELKNQNLEYTQPDQLKLESTNPIIENIRRTLEKIETNPQSPAPAAQEGNIMKVVLIDNADNVMARDVQVNEGIYNMLLQRLETAKITQRLQASKEGTRYTILEEPRIPLDPIKPDRVLVALIGLVIGVLTGFGLIVATEFLDKSFLDVEEAKEYLGVPLLGAISKIYTPESIRYETDKKRWMYSLTLLIGIAVLFITVTISSYLQ